MPLRGKKMNLIVDLDMCLSGHVESDHGQSEQVDWVGPTRVHKTS